MNGLVKGLPGRTVGLAVLLLLFTISPCVAQVVVVGMGDSVGQGVQSGDASAQTQLASYINWVAMKLGVPFPMPLIRSGPFGVVLNDFDTDYHGYRYHPYYHEYRQEGEQDPEAQREESVKHASGA